MELEELKSLWGEYDKKLDKNLRLNMELFRRMNFDKARYKVNALFVYKLLEMAFLIWCISWISDYAEKYLVTPRFGIAAIMLGLIFVIALISDIRQFIIIVQLQLKKHTDAIAPQQKLIETLKIRIVNFVRYGYFVIPLYPLMLILGGKIFFDIDFFNARHIHYLEANILLAVCLIPIVLIPFRKLGKQNIDTKAVRNFLQGSGWQTLNNAGEFLKQVDEFERES